MNVLYPIIDLNHAIKVSEVNYSQNHEKNQNNNLCKYSVEFSCEADRLIDNNEFISGKSAKLCVKEVDLYRKKDLDFSKIVNTYRKITDMYK